MNKLNYLDCGVYVRDWLSFNEHKILETVIICGAHDYGRCNDLIKLFDELYTREISSNCEKDEYSDGYVASFFNYEIRFDVFKVVKNDAAPMMRRAIFIEIYSMKSDSRHGFCCYPSYERGEFMGVRCRRLFSSSGRAEMIAKGILVVSRLEHLFQPIVFMTRTPIPKMIIWDNRLDE